VDKKSGLTALNGHFPELLLTSKTNKVGQSTPASDKRCVM